MNDLELRFEVDAADIPEIPDEGEAPETFVHRLAAAKAAYVASRHPGRRVLGADTVVALRDVILGKPRDGDDARRMLLGLAGTTHRVCTGIALLSACDLVEVAVVSTEVTFRKIGAAEIEAYLDSGEPFDKAGSYGIQGGGGSFVTSVSGSYSNVMGLPLIETAELLARRRPRS
jgi:septum formation protein